jgi:hypothetical protein
MEALRLHLVQNWSERAELGQQREPMHLLKRSGVAVEGQSIDRTMYRPRGLDIWIVTPPTFNYPQKVYYLNISLKC